MPDYKLDSLFSPANIASKISNVKQIGGIETSVMDDGYARGTRIAWFNTGSGLRFKVVLDRAMDIADAFFNQYGLAWHSAAGIMPHQFLATNGIHWLRTFAGGLVTTCGLSHIGGPETDEFGDRGVHGWISNRPAEIESIIQPDPATGNMAMSITGRVKEASIFGPHLELRRTISCTLGQSYIDIKDQVINRGNTPAPHMLLYHINLGWPLVDEGARLHFDGEMHYINEERDRPIFNDKNDFRRCSAPLAQHNGSGEAAAYFDIVADENGRCQCGITNHTIGISANVYFKKEQMRWLTNWQHWGHGEYVTGLEPGTNPPTGQAAARKNNSLIFLAPGEKKDYEMRLEVIAH